MCYGLGIAGVNLGNQRKAARMATIYIVTSGSYSDYGIDAVFSSEENAQTFIDQNSPFLDMGIEEYELDGRVGDIALKECKIPALP